jgi:uncharacterized protein YaaQ
MNMDIYHLNKEERAQQLADALEDCLVDNGFKIEGLMSRGGVLRVTDYIRGEFIELDILGDSIENVKVRVHK